MGGVKSLSRFLWNESGEYGTKGEEMGFDDSAHLSINRRDFLALSAGLITAMSLGGTLGTGISHATDIKFPEGRCGSEMEKRVLVTYASKYGSTGSRWMLWKGTVQPRRGAD
jgi:hypothetical protein